MKMRHHRVIKQLGRKTAHRYAMLRNLAASLIEHGSISTTYVRAKVLKSFVEPLITLGKKGDLSARRLALRRLPNKKAVTKLFTDIAPLYTERHGGYTRVLKMGTRDGDNAQLALVELVDKEKIKNTSNLK
jgi:large subunit ribosomal protein L17